MYISHRGLCVCVEILKAFSKRGCVLYTPCIIFIFARRYNVRSFVVYNGRCNMYVSTKWRWNGVGKKLWIQEIINESYWDITCLINPKMWLCILTYTHTHSLLIWYRKFYYIFATVDCGDGGCYLFGMMC